MSGLVLILKEDYMNIISGTQSLPHWVVPWKLCYKEEFEDLLSAKQREANIKKQKSRKIGSKAVINFCKLLHDRM
jgi:hypothetical protein